MPNRVQINYDVNRAMFHALVPTLIPEDEYDVGSTPLSLKIGPEPWANRLTAIFTALRVKYARLHASDIYQRAEHTYELPLAHIRDSIVDEIVVADLWFPTG